MSRNEDIREQIEELEQSLRSIEKEVDAAIALTSRKAIASYLEQVFGEAEPKDRDRWMRMAAQWQAPAAQAEKEEISEKKKAGDT
jgi:DNA-binding phage protein